MRSLEGTIFFGQQLRIEDTYPTSHIRGRHYVVLDVGVRGDPITIAMISILPTPEDNLLLGNPGHLNIADLIHVALHSEKDLWSLEEITDARGRMLELTTYKNIDLTEPSNREYVFGGIESAAEDRQSRDYTLWFPE